jgi:hypothetical protein
MDVREIHSLREVLSQETVRILVQTTLPRTSWIAEVHFDVGIQTEPLVIRHLLAMIPGQRFVEFPRLLVRMLDECIDHRLGVFAGYPYQHHVTCMTFNQGCDLTVVAADYQVTFPVSWNRSILDCGWSLPYRDCAGNATMCSRRSKSAE